MSEETPEQKSKRLKAVRDQMEAQAKSKAGDKETRRDRGIFTSADKKPS